MNVLKSTMLMAVMTVLLVFVGHIAFGPGGAKIFFLLALVMNGIAYWFSDKIILMRYRAQEVSPEQAPDLHRLVGELADAAGLPMPRVFIIPERSPNAFATGRNPRHAVVAVTEGLLQMLDREELAGVLGHELAHVKHYDMLTGTIAASCAGAVMMIASIARWGAIFGGFRGDDRGGNPIAMLAVAIFAPIAAVLVQTAISRSREFDADRGGAEIAGGPHGLMRALAKLERGASMIPMSDPAPATENLFIVNPLRGQSMLRLFSTHPATADRIEALRALER